MKLDLLVYGRGQERLEGYQLFAAPSYWKDEMLIAMSSFNDLWVQGDLSDTEKAAFAAEKNPWGKTYMFVYMNEPYCCALLRCTRVEGDSEGTWLKEARNFDIWSMEGVCCPFKHREKFFAMLPSVILWLEQDNTSLYRRLKDGKIGKTIEIPENLLYNPYTALESTPSDDLLNIFKDEKAKRSWKNLCNLMNYSSQPFYFLFGPLAKCFAERIGANYGINCVFSTIDDEIVSPPSIDPLSQMQTIKKRDVSKKRKKCNLYVELSESDNNIFYRNWSLINDESGKTEMQSENIQYEGNSIDLIQLEAEAETIRDFAVGMNWGINNSDNISERYIFEMEE